MTDFSLKALLSIYAAIKAHDNEIMARRPSDTSRVAWRMENPHNISHEWSLKHLNGRRFGATLNSDTKPILQIWSDTANPTIIDNIDLSADDAEARLSEYSIDTSRWFKSSRNAMGLSHSQLGTILDTDARTIRKWEATSGTNTRDPNPIACRMLELMLEGTLDAKALLARYSAR